MSSDAVTGYPKWEGHLSGSPRVGSIVIQEVRRAVNDQRGRSALILAFGYAIIFLAQTAVAASNRPSLHSIDTYLQFLGLLRWAAVGIAAVMTGTALLEDQRHGALELYLSRSVTRWGYLGGKLLAVILVTFLTMFGPALIYYGGAFFIFETQPDGWAYAILGAAGLSAIWAIVVSGIGLGLACVVRSARAASLILLGGLLGIQILLGDGLEILGNRVPSVLESITRGDFVKLGSPSSALLAQKAWLFNIPEAYSWPYVYGIGSLVAFAAAGWTLVWLRHPRIKGVE